MSERRARGGDPNRRTLPERGTGSLTRADLIEGLKEAAAHGLQMLGVDPAQHATDHLQHIPELRKDSQQLLADTRNLMGKVDTVHEWVTKKIKQETEQEQAWARRKEKLLDDLGGWVIKIALGLAVLVLAGKGGYQLVFG